MNRRYTGVLPLDHSTNLHLAQEYRALQASEHAENKLDELMEDTTEVASALDDLMGDSDVGPNGNTLFAEDLAAVLVGYSAPEAAKVTEFFDTLTRCVRQQLRPDAERLAQQEEQEAAEAHDAAVSEARDASANYRELGE